jgi:transposase
MTKDEELAYLRQENASLREELQQVKEHLQALQDQQAKDSHNSSLPPSSDRFVPRTKSLRKKSGNKPGGQKGHPGHHLMRSQTPDEILLHRVERCGQCGRELADQQGVVPESRQVFDLPARRLWVIEHRVEEKGCPCCGQLTRAAFPAAVRAPAQYGEGIAALGIYLVQGQFVPYARAAELFHEWFGVQMSAGSLARFIQQCHQQLAPVESRLKEALTQVPVLHQDETGLRVKTITHWVHVASTTHLTHYGAHRLRGRTAMEAIGISPVFGGISVHDGLLSYRAFGCEHALCNAHHLRELTFIEEAYQQAWAGQMKALLLKMKAWVQAARTRGASQLDPLSLVALSADYDRLIALGWQANAPPEGAPPRPRRGKQPPACNLLNRLQAGKLQVLAFLYNFAVPFDNNQAERDLRMLKVQQKISGGLRTQAGIEQVCRIRSYLSTLRKQGADLLYALHQTLLGDPVLPAF